MAGRRLAFCMTLLACCLLAWAAKGNAQPLITEFPLPGKGPVNYLPQIYGRSMTAGPDGAVWFTHFLNSRIVRMTTGGTLTEFDIGPGRSPSGIAVGSDRNLWFGILNGPMAIGRLSLSGQFAEFPLQLVYPTVPAGFAAGADGNIWFTEATQRLEANGPDATVIGKVAPGGQITEYPLPFGTSATGIIASGEGDLWFLFSVLVVAPGPHAGIQRVNLLGAIGPVVGSLDPDAGIAMTLGPGGILWFTTFGNMIGSRTPAGEIKKYAVPTQNSIPWDITAGPDGNLWFTEYAGNKIGRITPQGFITEFPVPTPDSGPAAICVGPDGNIWFTESNANKVGRLALSGPASGKATLTIPTAASKAGHNETFFHTDLWLMNRSYTAPAPVTLVYRCSGGNPCGVGSTVLSIPPRQELMLTDVIGQTFIAPGTSGAIEVSWPTSTGPVSASSKVSTPLPPAPAYGSMIPALTIADARMRALFLGLAWGGNLNSGSRSNAGAYNPQEAAVEVTFTLRSGDGSPLGEFTRTYGPLEAFQLSPNIFDLVGAGSAVTSNAYLVVTATAPVFPYVSVVDNLSGDTSWLPISDDEIGP